MLTKRNIYEIAQILKTSKNKKEIINKVALFCCKYNPKLNEYVFKRACGLTDTECGY